MNVVLVMFRENGERRSFSLTRDVTVIGRREDADFRIPLSDVSRKHCRLIKDGNQLIIEDLGSANGTFHNGQRVSDAEITPGDTVQIGPIHFVVQIDGVPTEEELLGVHGNNESGATHVVTAPAPPIFGAPPVPPSPPTDSSDELEIIEEDDLPVDPAGLVEVEPDQIFDNISVESTDSVADDDIIIDLGEPEETEKR